MGKKGYFFLIDSILALSVLSIGAFLIFTAVASAPAQQQPVSIANDLLAILGGTTIQNSNNPYIGIGGVLWDDGNLTSKDVTILHEVGKFFEANNLPVVQSIIGNISENIVPDQYFFELSISNTTVFPPERHSAHNISKNESRLITPAHGIIFGINNTDTYNLFGPHEVKVLIWQ